MISPRLAHTLAILLSNISYCYILLIALFHISDHPTARYPFAKIFLTQNDNPCKQYGWLELVLLLAVGFTHAYLVMEHMTARIDHPILQKRRAFLRILFFGFSTLLTAININFIRSLWLSGVPLQHFLQTPWMQEEALQHEMGVNFFYYHYFYSTVLLVLAFIVNIFVFVVTPLPIRQQHTSTTSKMSKSQAKRQQLAKAREQLKPVKEMLQHEALSELNTKYNNIMKDDGDVGGTEDFLGAPLTFHYHLNNNNDKTSAAPSDEDEDDVDSDEDYDEDDEAAIADRLDDLMDKMIDKIEKMQEEKKQGQQQQQHQKNEVKQNTHRNGDHGDSDTDDDGDDTDAKNEKQDNILRKRK